MLVSLPSAQASKILGRMQEKNFREAKILSQRLKLCTFAHSLVAQPGIECMSRKERQIAMVALGKAFVEIPFEIKLQHTKFSVGEAMKQGCHCTMSPDETSLLVEALCFWKALDPNERLPEWSPEKPSYPDLFAARLVQHKLMGDGDETTEEKITQDMEATVIT